MVGADEGDPLVALLDQMAGGQPGTVAIVKRYAAGLKPRQRTVDQHHAWDLAHPDGQFIVGQLLGMHHQGRTAMAHQLFNGLALFFGIVVTVTNQQKIMRGVGHLLHGFYHGTKEGIGNVRDNQAQGFGGLLCQRTGIGIGVILQSFHGGQHGGP
ncbi:hypothetical protein D3C81_1504100 [compost metagenome]